MTGGTFSKCVECGRLNIHGARCVCTPLEPFACDCKFMGNEQVIGPRCQQRIRDAWTIAIGNAR